jgi:hypothetical protein
MEDDIRIDLIDKEEDLWEIYDLTWNDLEDLFDALDDTVTISDRWTKVRDDLEKLLNG